ncbi:kinase-like protein [Tothia fuscella]|uniref:Kinase-like protein n=1 Tax=Tothia fuscella TaxID=1048955 RepID=A0A9P4U0R8_9PEZI|nr:kinase-like protein [Tothia fuscella]
MGRVESGPLDASGSSESQQEQVRNRAREKLQEMINDVKYALATRPEKDRVKYPLSSTTKVGNIELTFHDDQTTGTRSHNAAWILRKKLGQGGFGKCYHWIKYDTDTNSILDTVVCKIIDISEDEWNNRLYWYGDTNNREPIEAILHRRLTTAKIHGVIEFRGYALDKEKRINKIHIRYASEGTLDTLIRKFRERKPPVLIPEPLIWKVADRLLSTIEGMADGGGKEEGWVKILHRDFKTPNVALIPGRGGFSPLLLDFGGALEMTWDNPQDYMGIWSRLMAAPEQRLLTLDPPLEFGSHTDVYGLGAVLYGPVNGTTYYDYPNLVHHPLYAQVNIKPYALWEFGKHAGPMPWHISYSQELYAFVV